MNARRKPNESYISFLPTRNHGNEMSVSHPTIAKRGKVQSKCYLPDVPVLHSLPDRLLCLLLLN